MENSRADTLGVGRERWRRWKLKGVDNQDRIGQPSQSWVGDDILYVDPRTIQDRLDP